MKEELSVIVSAILSHTPAPIVLNLFIVNTDSWPDIPEVTLSEASLN